MDSLIDILKNAAITGLNKCDGIYMGNTSITDYFRSNIDTLKFLRRKHLLTNNELDPILE